MRACMKQLSLYRFVGLVSSLSLIFSSLFRYFISKFSKRLKSKSIHKLIKELLRGLWVESITSTVNPFECASKLFKDTCHTPISELDSLV